MPASLKPWPLDGPPRSPRCSWCGSSATLRYAAGNHYCRRCRRLFQDAPEIPFDVVADRWTPGLEALQTAGDVITVRLPGGFHGVCVLTGESVRQFTERFGLLQRGRLGAKV